MKGRIKCSAEYMGRIKCRKVNMVRRTKKEKKRKS